MTLADLLALAENCESRKELDEALSPEVVAALVRCVMAMDQTCLRTSRSAEAARAKLDRVLVANK